MSKADDDRRASYEKSREHQLNEDRKRNGDRPGWNMPNAAGQPPCMPDVGNAGPLSD